MVAMAGAGGAALYYVKWRGTAEDRTRSSEPRRTTVRSKAARYASVEIELSRDSCDRARALAGKPLLSRDAPSLPLDGCTAHCRCSFIKRSDRRQDKRRWADEGVAPMVYVADERRNSSDRRKT